jgi:hypothetical protein
MASWHCFGDHPTPPEPPDRGSDPAAPYAPGLMIRAGVGLLLLGLAASTAPASGWAWGIAATVLALDGLAAWSTLAGGLRRLAIPPRLLAADALVGGIGLAVDGRLVPAVPALLVLVAFEGVSYQPTRRGALLAEIYLLGANSLWLLHPPGPVNGLHWGAAARMGLWDAVDSVLLGAWVTAHAIPWRMPPGWEQLTPREREVYRLSRRGYTAAAIASQLHIEVSTVKTHLRHIRHKLPPASSSPPP